MGRRRIAGSRVLLTGASSGIGRELARQLAEANAQVVLTARRQHLLDELVEQLRQAGKRAASVAGDVTDAQHRRRLLLLTQKEMGGLDILVNNAGITSLGPFTRSAPENLRRVMEVNFFAPVELARQAIPLLRAGTRPIIVNVASVLAHRAIPNVAEYCSSKFALHGFSDALRAELAPEGIDVCLVSPATTSTEIFERAISDRPHPWWSDFGAAQPATVARQTIGAIRGGRHEVILSPGGKLIVWLDRLSPPVMNRLIARFARSEP